MITSLLLIMRAIDSWLIDFFQSQNAQACANHRTVIPAFRHACWRTVRLSCDHKIGSYCRCGILLQKTWLSQAQNEVLWSAYANNFDVGVFFMFNMPLGNMNSQPAGRVHQNKVDVWKIAQVGGATTVPNNRGFYQCRRVFLYDFYFLYAMYIRAVITIYTLVCINLVWIWNTQNNRHIDSHIYMCT